MVVTVSHSNNDSYNILPRLGQQARKDVMKLCSLCLDLLKTQLVTLDKNGQLFVTKHCYQTLLYLTVQVVLLLH